VKGKGTEEGLGKGLGEGESLGSVVKTAGWTWLVIQAVFSPLLPII